MGKRRERLILILLRMKLRYSWLRNLLGLLMSGYSLITLTLIYFGVSGLLPLIAAFLGFNFVIGISSYILDKYLGIVGRDLEVVSSYNPFLRKMDRKLDEITMMLEELLEKESRSR